MDMELCIVDGEKNSPIKFLFTVMSGNQDLALESKSDQSRIQCGMVLQQNAQQGGPCTTTSAVISTTVLPVIHNVSKHGHSVQSEPSAVFSSQTYIPTTVISRLTTLPVHTNATSCYHVPRGAAAVANIAIPRSSVATPVVRTSSNLTTVGIAPTPASSVRSASLGRIATPRITGTTPTPRVLQPATTPPYMQPRTTPITVASRLGVAGTNRTTTDVTPRPILLHTSPSQKHFTIAQHTSQQVTEKSFVKGSVGVVPMRSGVPTQTRLTPAPALTRISASSSVVSLHPAVLLPTQQSKAVAQVGSTTAIHIAAVPVSSVPQPALTAISAVVTRPVVLPTTSVVTGGWALPVVSNQANVLSTTQPTLSDALQPGLFIQSSQKQQTSIATTGQPVRFNPVMVVDPSRSVHSMTTMESSSLIQSSDSLGGNNSNSQVQGSKLNSSPRPSILRKRDNEGSPLKAQKNLMPLLSGGGPVSPPSPPKRPESRGNSGGQSSGGSTTISATSSPGLSLDQPDSPPLAVKCDDERPAEMSPRKKPRKQQLHLNAHQMQEPKFSEGDDDFKYDKKISPTKVEGKPVVAVIKPPLKRVNVSLLTSYRHTWKSRHNHFIQYSDVKPKDERRPTVNDLANQKRVLQKVNGWKMYHHIAHLEDMSDLETDVYQRLTALLKATERKLGQESDEKEVNRFYELIKANIQRSKVIKDQLEDAKAQVAKIVEHKVHARSILNRCAIKRCGKKTR